MPTLPVTLTAAQIMDAASAAIVSRFPKIFTPTPNALESAAYSKCGKFCENPKLPVSGLTADTELGPSRVRGDEKRSVEDRFREVVGHPAPTQVSPVNGTAGEIALSGAGVNDSGRHKKMA
ncbi:hypothetical protein [Mycobacterium sp. OAE908]|uniref:hypothetical protein n=1 Tax=Mycobacterium sp. OAE908 TaxID=2817899 RepID=UPI001AEA795E